MAAQTCDTARDELPEADGAKAESAPLGATGSYARWSHEKGMNQDVSDRQIADGVYRGEAWAAASLYERVRIPVERALLRLLRYGDHEREDLMQEAFEKMVRSLGKKGLPGECNLPAWSSAVATNLALDHLRRRGRERRIFADPVEQPLSGDGPDVTRDAEARERLRITQHVLSGMRAKYAEALVLHDVLGHDLAEMAVISGTSVAAVQSRLSRGRREFQERMGSLQDRKPPTMVAKGSRR